MRFTLSILASVVLALQVTAQSFLAFNGNDCGGTQGLVVACDGTCFDFTGEHSFEAGDVTFFEGADCTGESFNFGAEAAGECINVNTGTNIQSFICT
ncbi:hypothetical protein K438DRAFT_1626224 [Mycena galopus ATCC 62051]|nr:hypothetical protein K438DRAFT_1626224 [Mycena galopus ATCC 62051]